MICYTGELIDPHNSTAPRIKSIGVQLGKMVRFAGGLQEWWSVLHHSLAAYHVAKALYNDPQVELYALIHDAHEAVTNDVPRYWKPESLSLAQEYIDLRIFSKLDIGLPGKEVRDKVKLIDNLLLAAEARVLKLGRRPELVEELIQYPADTTEEMHKIAKDIIIYYHCKYPTPNHTAIATSAAVKEFMVTMRNAIKAGRKHDITKENEVKEIS